MDVEEVGPANVKDGEAYNMHLGGHSQTVCDATSVRLFMSALAVCEMLHVAMHASTFQLQVWLASTGADPDTSKSSFPC